MRGLRRGNIAVQTMHFSDRKKPSLCIVEGNCATVIGNLRDDECAEQFWNTLEYIINIKQEEIEK